MLLVVGSWLLVVGVGGVVVVVVVGVGVGVGVGGGGGGGGGGGSGWYLTTTYYDIRIINQHPNTETEVWYDWMSGNK